jgi:signal transduction histidine kinase
MREKYTDGAASGSGPAAAAARELLARLLPGADAGLLVAGLRAEAERRADSSEVAMLDDANVDPPERELRRVRRQFALGEAARSAQHDLNNPLTALIAEVQMLELEGLAPEHRAATRRIVELARRIAVVARRLDVSPRPVIG